MRRKIASIAAAVALVAGLILGAGYVRAEISPADSKPAHLADYCDWDWC